jgi:hypothetical protein
MSKYIPTIPVRDLTEVSFTPIKTKPEQFSKQELTAKLKRACKNGNNDRNKHTISFTTSNGWMKINTTIWMVGDEFVLLKENLYIPINSIIDVT